MFLPSLLLSRQLFLSTYVEAIHFLEDAVFPQIEKMFFDAAGQRIAFKQYCAVQKFTQEIAQVAAKTQDTFQKYRIFDQQGVEIPHDQVTALFRTPFVKEVDAIHQLTRSFDDRVPSSLPSSFLDPNAWFNFICYRNPEAEQFLRNSSDLDFFRMVYSNHNASGGNGGIKRKFASALTDALKKAHLLFHDKQHLETPAQPGRREDCHCLDSYHTFTSLSSDQQEVICKETMRIAFAALEAVVENIAKLDQKGVSKPSLMKMSIEKVLILRQELTGILDTMPTNPPNILATTELKISLQINAAAAKNAAITLKDFHLSLEYASSFASDIQEVKDLLSKSGDIREGESITKRQQLLNQLSQWSALFGRVEEQLTKELDHFAKQ